MAEAEGLWTLEKVAARLQEAATTGRRLPKVSVQSYYNTWPTFMRQKWERWAAEDRPVHRFPPNPEAVERMLETLRWMVWLREEQRRLLWMRAHGQRWRDISACFGCNRSTAWRHWEQALGVVATKLNTPKT